MTLPIRVRLTAWYVGVLAAVTLASVGGSLWLSTQSVISAADVGLRARVDGVRAFLENPQTRVTVEGLRDEFGEYAELTRGEALLDVSDEAGTSFIRPSIPGWAEMERRLVTAVPTLNGTPQHHVIGGQAYRVLTGRLDARGAAYRVIVAAPMSPAYAALNRFRRWLLLSLPLAFALAAAGGYWVSRRALAPVDAITHAVQAITLERIERRVPVPVAHDELRRLATTFNDVLARLQVAVSNIVRFTADASHELRTPVALVRTTAELALRHERTSGEYREALTEILSHARQMSTLVEDLLVLARTEGGIDARVRAVMDLRGVVSDACHEVDSLAHARDITILADTPPHAVMVSGHADALHRLVLILLDNAVKYSLPGGSVHLQLRVQPASATVATSATLEVRDHGIGLDTPASRRLFERFYRGERARQHIPEGTGLGLAIAHVIVAQHGGSISVTPGGAADGVGCCATVVLPLAASVFAHESDKAPIADVQTSRSGVMATSPELHDERVS